MLDLMTVVLVLALLIILWRMVIYFFFRRTCYLDANGKVVLVTGCDSGIGLQVCQFLYSQGLTIIATCLNEHSEGAEHLMKSGKFDAKRMFVTRLDVTEKTSIEACCLFICNVLNETGNKGNLFSCLESCFICFICFLCFLLFITHRLCLLYSKAFGLS